MADAVNALVDVRRHRGGNVLANAAVPAALIYALNKKYGKKRGGSRKLRGGEDHEGGGRRRRRRRSRRRRRKGGGADKSD